MTSNPELSVMDSQGRGEIPVKDTPAGAPVHRTRRAFLEAITGFAACAALPGCREERRMDSPDAETSKMRAYTVLRRNRDRLDAEAKDLRALLERNPADEAMLNLVKRHNDEVDGYNLSIEWYKLNKENLVFYDDIEGAGLSHLQPIETPEIIIEGGNGNIRIDKKDSLPRIES